MTTLPSDYDELRPALSHIPKHVRMALQTDVEEGTVGSDRRAFGGFGSSTTGSGAGQTMAQNGHKSLFRMNGRFGSEDDK